MSIDAIEDLKTEIYRLKEMIRGENLSAAVLADANNAKDVAEDELERRTQTFNDQVRWREDDLLTFEMALEDIVKVSAGPWISEARRIAERALAEVEARHKP